MSMGNVKWFNDAYGYMKEPHMFMCEAIAWRSSLKARIVMVLPAHGYATAATAFADELIGMGFDTDTIDSITITDEG